MKKTVLNLGVVAALVLPMALQAQSDDPDAARKRLSIAAMQEFGSLSRAYFDGNPPYEDEWIDRFGVFMTHSASLSDRLSFNIGLGGIFQYQKDERVSAVWLGSQFRDFYIGPTRADLNYLLGDVANPWGELQFGMFPYKYSKASNLGEYLFRSGPYPTYVWTGGYSTINSANANLQGLRFGWTGIENLAVDVIVNTETGIPPLYDFTLTALAKYTVLDGLVEVGGGVQFKRLIPLHGDSTQKVNQGNSYFKVGGKYYTGYTAYYEEQRAFWQSKYNEDSLPADLARANQFQADYNTAVAGYNNPAVEKEYYDAAGTTVVGMVTVDGKKLFPSQAWGKRDLELYGEVALLGVKNYPVFYENRLDRMPMMAGFNVPTLGVLDLLSLEVEWFNSPWINSFGRLGQESGGATPKLPNAGEVWYSENAYNDISDKDNVSWSLLMQKKVAKVITISGQVARDHARFVSRTNWFGPNVDPQENLIESGDWYWMLQLSFGI